MILRSVRKGGTSFDKTLISIIVNKEKALLNKIMCNSKPSPYYNNSEYVINIFGAKLKFELNDFNKNKMLTQLILFIHYVYKDKSILIIMINYIMNTIVYYTDYI